MRILLTGASGYVGRHVWPHFLAAGHDICALSRGKQGKATEGLRWISADLLQPGETERVVKVAKPDIVLHLAWEVGHGTFWTSPDNLNWVGATLALARAAAEHNARRFIATGTCFEYDWPEDGDCIEGQTPLAAHTLYDTAKDACRRVLEAYANRSKMSFAWARIFHLYGGPENPARLVPDVARALAAGKPARCASGKPVRDFMDVEQAGRALAALALSDVEGCVNIASGNPVSLATIVQTLGQVAGRPDLVELGALPDRKGEPPRIAADINRLKNEAGFECSQTLEQGLAKAYARWSD